MTEKSTTSNQVFSAKVAAPLFNRVFRTFIIVVVARLVNYIPIPIPGVSNMETFYDSSFYNFGSFSAGSNVLSICGLGLGPYFSASLLVQFLIKFYPFFEKLQKEEGDNGRKKIVQYTRILTILFSIIEGFFLSNSLRSYAFDWSILSYVIVIFSLSTGTLFLVWLSELITERGIGNGSSILILVSNLARCPAILIDKDDFISAGFDYKSTLYIFYFSLTLLVMTLISSFIQETTKKILILSPRQIVSGSLEDLKISYIPLRFGQAGVVPIIFSSSILLFFKNAISSNGLFPFLSSINNNFIDTINQVIYFFTFLVLIIFFSFFYNLIILDPEDIAKDLKKTSSIIKNVRTGFATKIYLRKAILETSIVGSFLLSGSILVPFIIAKIFNVPALTISGITSIILSLNILHDTSRQIIAYFETRRFLILSED